MSKYMPTRAANGVSSSPVTAGTLGGSTGPGTGLPGASAGSVPGRDSPNTLVIKTMKTGHGAGAKKGLREGFLGGKREAGFASVLK